MSFKDNFTWGVASSSYQIEGAADADGKGDSVWDVFCRNPENIKDGYSGEIACDHYNRYKEDVALMAELGVKGYRFSLSWPRILPDGTGTVNQAGLNFYNRLIDELLDNNIQPWITLFHWDYPQALFERDGWLNPESPDWYAEYAGLVTNAFSDRVSKWMTHNEIQVFTGHAHLSGKHAPGLKLGIEKVLHIGHNALLAHGKAVLAMRAAAKQSLSIGYAPAGQVYYPATDSEADIEAARTRFNAVSNEYGGRDTWNNTWWMDPVFLGEYPKEGFQWYGDAVPDIGPDDMKIINQPLDWCGINVYYGKPIKAGPDGKPEQVRLEPGYNRTSQSGWNVSPDSIYWAAKFTYERYGKPIVITENGHQNLDAVMLDGKVHDPQRIDYLHRYLMRLEDAVNDGVPVDGYFQWTLMDNFEWALGYNVRVGLVFTDFTTLKRTPKDSFYWYKKVIETNGASL